MGRHNDAIVVERNKWLRRWAARGIFTPKEIEDALAEPLTASRGSVPGFVPQLALKLKKSGRIVIHTSIDLNTQLKIEKLVKDYSRTLTLKNIRNAAVIVLDNQTHRVVSYVGSADFQRLGGWRTGEWGGSDPTTGEHAEAVIIWIMYRWRAADTQNDDHRCTGELSTGTRRKTMTGSLTAMSRWSMRWSIR